MSNKNKAVVMEKDGVQTEITRQQFKGLATRGWTVVEDGDNNDTNSVSEENRKLQEQEDKLFGPLSPEDENPVTSDAQSLADPGVRGRTGQVGAQQRPVVKTEEN